MANYPCRSCVYFRTCGDNMRTHPCNGRVTPRDIKRTSKPQTKEVKS